MKIVVVSASEFNDIFNKLSPVSRVVNLDLPTANLMFRAQNVLMVVDSEVSVEAIDHAYGPLSIASLSQPSGMGPFKTVKERANG